jgi:hypothetical protein
MRGWFGTALDLTQKKMLVFVLDQKKKKKVFYDCEETP